MVVHLDYFRECDMNHSNLEGFYESLPRRLQDILKVSLHTSIDTTNVLQGYRGPSDMCNGESGDSGVLKSSNGMQEIRFWFGFRKDANYIPVVGTVAFVLTRSKQIINGELAWSSLYFDSKTGECLSHNKDEAAEKLNGIGLRLYTEGKYTQAAEYHFNAYQACSNGYCYEQTFKNDEEKAKSKQKDTRYNDY